MNITEINIYPVKSLKGFRSKKAVVEKRGLELDRRWMLVDEKNKFLTQRELPKMATLETQIVENKLKIRDGEKEISVSLQPEIIENLNVQIWSGKCRARVYEEEVNNWFSEVLQKKCRMVFMPEDSKRIVNPLYAVNKFKDVVSFADGYPLLIIGESSLKDLISRMDAEIPMNRFRPNLVFDASEPFAEDTWKKIKIGTTIFHVVKPCDRCMITTIDQEKGVFDGKEPLKTLSEFRLKKRGNKSKVLFGQYLIAENVGNIVKVGDEIEVLESKN